jgi:NDP-sugar pyrophosphorylase family protein
MIKQAVILAGGKGTRLYPLTKNIPKPMVCINKVPFLNYLIFYLKKKGIKKILILVGYKSKKITQFYKNFKNLEISFSYSEVQSDTGRRLLEAKNNLKNEFLLLYGDNFWIPNLSTMYKKFIIKKAMIGTTIFNNKNGTAEYGFQNNVLVDSNSMVMKYDKTRKDKLLNGVDIGFFIVKKKFLNNFKIKKNYSFENDILTKAIKLKKLCAFRTDRQYYSITNIKMLKKFEKIAKYKNLRYIKNDQIL